MFDFGVSALYGYGQWFDGDRSLPTRSDTRRDTAREADST
jgi:hypothetical protein